MKFAQKAESQDVISMKFSFEVGELEKHQVEFNFNQLCGTLLIRVDNKPVSPCHPPFKRAGS